MNISSILVHAKPAKLPSVRGQLEQIPGVEIHAATDDGRLIVTIEAASDGETTGIFDRINAMDGVLSVAGGAAIQLAFRASREGGERPRQGRLELAPEQAGYLRVVADPWAHVIVDGQKLETTPFAKPIPLSAGTHYVRLEHPRAPEERRTIHLIAGETIVLDVNMKVDRPARANKPGASPSSSAGPEPWSP